MQTSALRVLEAAPNGVISELTDANEIRVIFSEPMVALGRVPTNPTPPWIHIAPTIKGAFRWSGTTILIFTPDHNTPLPYATRFDVTIDRTAESAAGHQLAASYQFAFTTPVVKLMAAQWARQGARFDSQVALALTFNQPVRPADVLAHTTVRYEPHEWSAPALSADARMRLQATDPDGLRRFDAKVAATTRVARAATPVPVRLALNWNRDRFGSDDTMVVLETTSPPPPESWLRITVDEAMPSKGGPVTPGRLQTSTHQLDRALFVTRVYCSAECVPSHFNAIEFATAVAVDSFAGALTVHDVTNPASETPLTPKKTVRPAGQFDNGLAHSVEDAGFDRQPPAHSWLLHVASALTSVDGQTLGYPWLGTIENWHDLAFTSFGDGHGVWEKDGGPLLPFSARNIESVTQWLMRLAPADLMPRILALEKGAFEDTPPGSGTDRRLHVTPDAIEAHGFDLAPSLSPQGTGLFWAAMLDGDPIPHAKRPEDGDPRPHSTLVQVTNLGITVKDSPLSTLIFVTRLDTGAPVQDARVSVISRANKALWTGRTGRDGVALTPALAIRELPSHSQDDEESPRVQYVVTAEKDGDVAYAVSNWDEGIEPWSFGMNYGLWESAPVLRGSVFTDRGVYRPGEDVHFKLIARSDTPTGMRLLGDGALVDINVTDSRDRTVDHRTVKVNHWSSADWTWTVPATGVVGDYAVAIQLAKPAGKAAVANDVTRPSYGEDWLQTIHGSFLVAAYRRPDFRVDATTTIDQPVAGNEIHASLEARYLFGAAMANRPVHWTLTHDPDFSVPSAITDRREWQDYRFGYYPDGSTRRSSDRAAAEDATLDANGKLVLSLPTDRTVDFAYRYTFEGDVEDASRQRIANRAGLVVYPAPWFIGIRLPDYFADPKKGTTADVAVVDRNGAAVTGVSVKVSLIHVQWNSVRHAEGRGFYSWETQKVEKPAGEWTITSAASPFSQAIPVPEGGFYVLRATASDLAGHTTRTEESFYGVGDGYTAWERFDNNRIKFEPEHATWKPGETARLMIQSPWESATALLTVEREGVRRYQQFALTSTQQTVTVPLTEADIPNVFVSILLVRGRASKEVGKEGDDPGKPAFRLGYAQLKVEDATKHLAVKVTADHEEYRPANAAKVAVTVNDAAGKGSASEVTLWAVDYGILSLTDYATPDVLASVWTDKQLQVATVDSRQRIISRRVLTPKGETDGGGGGKDGGPGGARKDFRPLAFWLGSLETDKSGKATATVALPESLTTYRIMAVAGDASSRFGSTSAEIRVSKPVTIVPALPRFLTMGDRASMGAVVTNTTKAGGAATVTARSLDPAILDFEGGSQTVTLGAGASDAARFAAVAHKTGVARVEMTVKLGDNTDAFQTTVPVSALTPLEMTAAFGDTDGKTTIPLALPTGVMSDLGGLQIDMASTALVGLGEGVRYLNEYGYDCAEQKASRALGLLLAADLGQAFSMGRIAPADYRKTALGLLAELPAYQCPDGGFTFWPGACYLENGYLTAYILDVMKTASGLNAPSDQKVIGDALDYLDRVVKAPTPRPMPVQMVPGWGSANAYAVKVLTMYGRNEDSNITRLMGVADQLPVFALSYLADALGATKDRGPRYQQLVTLITNALRIEGDQAHAEELDTDTMAWLWDSNVRASAIVLEGFVRRGDDRVFIERLVRWLLASRVKGRWPNTQDNISALRALVGYYKVFEATPPDMTAYATFGSTVLGTASFKGRSTTTQSVQLSMQDLVDRLSSTRPTPDLVLSRSGTGRLYYTARLSAATTGTPPAVDHGIAVERRYEKYVENGTGAPSTTFNAGDLVRVTLTVTVPKERRFVAVTDPLPAGLEPVDGWFSTTASDLARDASTFQTSEGSVLGWQEFWRHGGFDNVEKYDDRVIVFGTRLGEGRHEFSYIVRATTAGTFKAAGAVAEEMYAPDVQGRAATTTIVIR